MQHSPVGFSAVNVVIESVIQRVRGQVRAIKLDLETTITAKFNPPQTIWPWLIEDSAQTLLLCRLSGDDGLTVIWRIRRRSTTGPLPNKPEASWKHVVWIGSIQASAEHLIGIPLCVVKATALSALPDGQRFEAKAIDEMQGAPWRPSTQHQRTRVRTHITDEEEQDKNEVEENQEIQMKICDYEELGETAEDVAKKQDVTFS